MEQREIDYFELEPSQSVPDETKVIISKFKACKNNDELYALLGEIPAIWQYGMCELSHWSEVLKKFDSIIEECCKPSNTTSESDKEWPELAVDQPEFGTKSLLLRLFSFSDRLIENTTGSCEVYTLKHCISLLSSTDLHLVASTLKMLFLRDTSRDTNDDSVQLGYVLRSLMNCLEKKESGASLLQCCQAVPMDSYPSKMTTLKLDFINATGLQTSISIENAHLNNEPLVATMSKLINQFSVPRKHQYELFAKLRAIRNLTTLQGRLKCVQVRILAVLIRGYYENEDLKEFNVQLLEELIQVLNISDQSDAATDVKIAAAMAITVFFHCMPFDTLTSITGLNQPSGKLPSLIIANINCLVSSTIDHSPFGVSLLTLLYKLVYKHPKAREYLVQSNITDALFRLFRVQSSSLAHMQLLTQVMEIVCFINSAIFQPNNLCAIIHQLEIEMNNCQTMATYQISSGPIETAKWNTKPRTAERCDPIRELLILRLLLGLKPFDVASSIALNNSLSFANALLNILSNGHYYGMIIFDQAIQVIDASAKFNNSYCETILNNGFFQLILKATLIEQMPLTAGYVESLSGLFKTMCAKNTGLQLFRSMKPFRRFVQLFTSPTFLLEAGWPNAESVATELGKSMAILLAMLKVTSPELLREMIEAIILVFNDIYALGSNPRYMICKTTNYKTQDMCLKLSAIMEQSSIAELDSSTSASPTNSKAESRVAIPLYQFISMAVCFTKGLFLSSDVLTKQEFINQKGIDSMLTIFSLGILPPNDLADSRSLSSIGDVCTDNEQFQMGALEIAISKLNEALHHPDFLDIFTSLDKPRSVLLGELAEWLGSSSCVNTEQANGSISTPTLQVMASAARYFRVISMIINFGEWIDGIAAFWCSRFSCDVLCQVGTLFMVLVKERIIQSNPNCCQPVASQTAQIQQLVHNLVQRSADDTQHDLDSHLKYIKNLTVHLLVICEDFLANSIQLVMPPINKEKEALPKTSDGQVCLKVQTTSLCSVLRYIFQQQLPSDLANVTYCLQLFNYQVHLFNSVMLKFGDFKPFFLQCCVEEHVYDGWIRSFNVMKEWSNEEDQRIKFIETWLTEVNKFIDPATFFNKEQPLNSCHKCLQFNPVKCYLETQKVFLNPISELWVNEVLTKFKLPQLIALFGITSRLFVGYGQAMSLRDYEQVATYLTKSELDQLGLKVFHCLIGPVFKGRVDVLNGTHCRHLQQVISVHRPAGIEQIFCFLVQRVTEASKKIIARGHF